MKLDKCFRQIEKNGPNIFHYLQYDALKQLINSFSVQILDGVSGYVNKYSGYVHANFGLV